MSSPSRQTHAALFRRARIESRPAQYGVPEFVLFGRYNYTTAQPALEPHAHRNAIELCFLVKGRQTYRVGDQDYRLRGGDVFVTFPDEQHSTGSTPEEKGVLYWMILSMPDAGAPFLGLPPPLAQPLVNALLTLQPTCRHFRGSWDLRNILDAMLLVVSAPAEPLRATRLATLAATYLLRLLDCAGRAPAVRPDLRLHRVVQYIEQHLTEPLALPALAARSGLSVSRFKTRFKQETGVPPVEYILRARIAEARRRLVADGCTVTEVAYALGFSSSQYFATVYKRFTGERPSMARASRRPPPPTAVIKGA